MKILISESQYKVLVEQESEDVCVQDELDTLNDFLGGIVTVEPEDIGGELSHEDLLSTVTDPKEKNMLTKVLNNLSQMNMEQLRDQLKKVMSLRNIKEQQTPYMDRTTDIAGVQVPTAVVHGSLGLLAIAILTKMIKGLSGMSTGGGRRGGRRARLASRATGCQGGAARAKLVRMRRRRESWRRFLKKLGLR